MYVTKADVCSIMRVDSVYIDGMKYISWNNKPDVAMPITQGSTMYLNLFFIFAQHFINLYIVLIIIIISMYQTPITIPK